MVVLLGITPEISSEVALGNLSEVHSAIPYGVPSGIPSENPSGIRSKFPLKSFREFLFDFFFQSSSGTEVLPGISSESLQGFCLKLLRKF